MKLWIAGAIPILSAWTAAHAQIPAASPAGASASYRVVWDATRFPVAHVEARLNSSDCTFATSNHWATFFDGDNGWSQFITNLAARDRRGRPIAVQAQAGGKWRVGRTGGPCAIQLSYDVDFSFGRETWSAGNEQVAYTSPDGVYSTGLPLFVVADDGPAQIAVEVPRGWQFGTPWQPAGGNRFVVQNQKELLENTFMVGRFAAQSFRAGRFTATIGLLGHPASSAELFKAQFSKLAPKLVNMFGDTREGRYMIALINGPEDGESFQNSFAVSTANAPTERNKIIWANHLSHELIHYWIGKAINPADAEQSQYKWFTEGFTEYLANRALLDTGIYSEADFRGRLARHIGNYLLTRQNPLFMKTSLSQAGERGWPNRPLIYSGGATLAFCLDGQIRKKSHGLHDITDMMKQLFSHSQRGEKFTSAAFIEEATELTGIPYTSFYKTYVDGTESLPVEQCATDLGMEALTQGYDVFLEPASRESGN